MDDERIKRYSRSFISMDQVLAYLLQICRRSGNGQIARAYLEEKIFRAAKSQSERNLVDELDEANLELYDQCLGEILKSTY